MLLDRVLLWLLISQRRGLLQEVIHGEAREEEVGKEINGMLEVSNHDGICCLKGREHLIPETRRRLLRNGIVGKRYEAEARRFSDEYASLCPFIRCNIFVEQGCKYTVYLLGILLSLKYSLPFVRQDAYMAYELLKQKPYALFGGRI